MPGNAGLKTVKTVQQCALPSKPPACAAYKHFGQMQESAPEGDHHGHGQDGSSTRRTGNVKWFSVVKVRRSLHTSHRWCTRVIAS